MWLQLLTSKDQAAEAIKRFKARAEAKSGKRLRVLRTDRGGEFTSVEFVAYCADEGVVRHHIASYSPQQNGVVEQWNQTVVGMDRSMMKAKAMPAEFWGEAVSRLCSSSTARQPRPWRGGHRSRRGMAASRTWHFYTRLGALAM
jgi:transposase InsO family protein